jgi:hypothetical protein
MNSRRYGIGAFSRDTGRNIETIGCHEKIGLLSEAPPGAGGDAPECLIINVLFAVGCETP